MTANQDAAQLVLTSMGLPAESIADALAATESVVDVFRHPDTPGLTAQWECAAEFVAAFAAVTGYTGGELRQVTSLARAAFKLRRF